MIRDIFTLIDPAPYDRAAVVRVLKRRLNAMAKGGNKSAVPSASNSATGKDTELERDLKDILGAVCVRSLRCFGVDLICF